MFEAGSIIFRIQAAGAQVFVRELDQADQAAKKTAKSTSDAAKSTEDLGNKQETAKQKARRLAQEQAEAARRARELADAQNKVGTALAAVGIAAAAVAGLTVKAAKDWETAWTGVTKTVDGTEQQMSDLEGDLRGLTKILPATHEEIAAVAEAAGQLGVQRENVAAFTKTMIDLGETTNLSADEAATSLAQFMNIFQTAPDDVDRLGAAVVALGNDGASTERDIVQMAQRLAGAAKVVGLTEGETLGLANALASVGIEAEAGGSAVSNIMIDIAQAVSENGGKLQEWAKVAGVSADELAQRFRTKPAEALNLIITGMGRLQKSGGDVFGTLQQLGQTDVRVTRALLNLAGAGNLLSDSLELGNQAWEDNNALQEEAQKRYATTDSKIQLAKNAVVDMAIELGDHLLPIVNDVADGVKGFSDFIGSIPDEWQSSLVMLGLVVGAIALVGGTALLAVPKIVAFRAALETLTKEMPRVAAAGKGLTSFLTGPWGVAFAAAGLGINLLYDYLQSFLVSDEEFQKSLQKSTSAAAIFNQAMGKQVPTPSLEKSNALLKELQPSLEDAIDNWQDWTNGLSGTSEATLNVIKGVGQGLSDLADTDLPRAQQQFRLFADETDGSTRQLWALLSNMPEFRDSLEQTAISTGLLTEGTSDAERKQILLDLAMGGTTESTTRNAAATNEAADAYLNAADASAELYDQLEKLLDQLNEANEVGQDAISANADYQKALSEVSDYLDQARKGVEGYTLSLDPNTEAGSANREMLAGLASDAWDAASAQYELDKKTMSTADATELFRQRLEGSREQLLERIHEFGLTGQAAEDLANQILSIPSESEWKLIADTSAAAQLIDNFINTYNGKSITLDMFLDSSGGNRTAAASAARYTGQALAQLTHRADGGIRYAANGLLSQQQAQFRRAGSYIMWAEDETGGETFIPHAPAKRPQSTQLLRKTANEFGYDLVPYGQRQASSDAAIMAGAGRPATQRVTGTLKVDLTNGEAYLDGVLLGELR